MHAAGKKKPSFRGFVIFAAQVPNSFQVTEKDGQWTIKTSTTLKTMELKFKIGEEFDEVTPDGRCGVIRRNGEQAI
jgi:hypothetical protein